jgi:hypothetical protein
MEYPEYPQGMDYNTLPTSTLAIISLIAGIMGFFGFLVVGSIVAILAGYSARGETRSTPPRATGDGMATAGIWMGWIQIGLIAVALCIFIAYFVFVIGLVDQGH